MKGIWRYCVLFALPGFLLAVSLGMLLDEAWMLLDGTMEVKLLAALMGVLGAALLGAFGSMAARRCGWDYFTHAAAAGGVLLLAAVQNTVWPWRTPTLQAAAALAVTGAAWGWMTGVVADRRMVTLREAWCWVLAVLAGAAAWHVGYLWLLHPYLTTMHHWIGWCCVLGWLVASPLTRKGRKRRRFWFVWLGGAALLGYFFPPVFLPPPPPALREACKAQGWHWVDLHFSPDGLQNLFCGADGCWLVTDGRGKPILTTPADAELADTALAALLGTGRPEGQPDVLVIGAGSSRWAAMAVECGLANSLSLYGTATTADRETALQLNPYAVQHPLLFPDASFQLAALLLPPQSADRMLNRKHLLQRLRSLLDGQGVLLVPTALAESPEWRSLLHAAWRHCTLLPGGRVAAFSDRVADFSLAALERKNRECAESRSNAFWQGILPILYEFPEEKSFRAAVPAAAAARWALPEYDWCEIPGMERNGWRWGLLAVLLAERGAEMLFRRRHRSGAGWRIFRAGMLCGWSLGFAVAVKSGEALASGGDVWVALILLTAAWFPGWRKLPLRWFGLLWCLVWGFWGWIGASGEMTFCCGAWVVFGAALLASGMIAQVQAERGSASPWLFGGLLTGCGGVIAALAGGAPWWFFIGIGVILMWTVFERKVRMAPEQGAPEGERTV